MRINYVMNKDFVKILNFIESYVGLFTQQSIKNANISYHVKIAHTMSILKELGIIKEVVVEGTGNIKLYKFNNESYIYKHIKSLIDLIEKKESNWTDTTNTTDIFSSSTEDNWHEKL